MVWRIDSCSYSSVAGTKRSLGEGRAYSTHTSRAQPSLREARNLRAGTMEENYFLACLLPMPLLGYLSYKFQVYLSMEWSYPL